MRSAGSGLREPVWSHTAGNEEFASQLGTTVEEK